jgi:stringent starvation protein B
MSGPKSYLLKAYYQYLSDNNLSPVVCITKGYYASRYPLLSKYADKKTGELVLDISCS